MADHQPQHLEQADRHPEGLEAVEAARVACDEQNIKTESEVQDFLREQGLTIYEADVAAFADHVLETYLADPISDTWDKDLLAQIQAMA